ncbi:unnamed protein product, partial [marine sediment metagenome]
YIREPLVISYLNFNRNAKMTNTLRRISGVVLFLKKWKPIINKNSKLKFFNSEL